jgi:hypothetical protein
MELRDFQRYRARELLAFTLTAPLFDSPLAVAPEHRPANAKQLSMTLPAFCCQRTMLRWHFAGRAPHRCSAHERNWDSQQSAPCKHVMLTSNELCAARRRSRGPQLVWLDRPTVAILRCSVFQCFGMLSAVRSRQLDASYDRGHITTDRSQKVGAGCSPRSHDARQTNENPW